MGILFLCAVAIFAFQCLLFLIALVKKNNGIADIGWGIGFIVIAAITSFYYCLSFLVGNLNSFSIQFSFCLIVALVLVWGLRLSIYLLIRNWNKPEDWRYAKWREEWGSSFYIRSFLQVFLLQGVFMLVIGSPIILSLLSVGDFQSAAYFSDWIILILYILGGSFWLIGFFFQAVGDYQLFVFKKDISNKGKVMRYGVWQYTRHPNYFGESTMWWGIFLISCISAHDMLGVALRIIGPATITFMLLRVSGVTMLENKYKGNKEYEDYQMNTSSFIPMSPKQNR